MLRNAEGIAMDETSQLAELEKPARRAINDRASGSGTPGHGVAPDAFILREAHIGRVTTTLRICRRQSRRRACLI